MRARCSALPFWAWGDLVERGGRAEYRGSAPRPAGGPIRHSRDVSSVADSPAREPAPSSEAVAAAVQRLLEAWRGEVEAGAGYRGLAAPPRDPPRGGGLLPVGEAQARPPGPIGQRLRPPGGWAPGPPPPRRPPGPHRAAAAPAGR